jgi:hypothetical protein
VAEQMFRVVTRISRPDGSQTTSAGEPIPRLLAEAWCAESNGKEYPGLIAVSHIEPVGGSDEYR